ncbi:MAG: hypothetical protein JXA77_08440 [Bacteroidales bacterium]|nr:hypothetical protein [Bacteroidales bacterium]MBN2820958.1 hypothetical protein [Bacteroidales bacterium]
MNCNGKNKPAEAKEKYDVLSVETQNLYSNLKELAAKGFMFGHQDDVAYGIGWAGGEFNSDVEKISGDYPAVFGWDIGHIDSLNNIDGIPFTSMKKWMVEVYNRGGINTISWHERNLKTGQSSWDVTPVVTDMLLGGSFNERFNSQLDKVADLIGSLVAENGVRVPVIFRPFHEHNGSWFWWGKIPCSDSLYKELFRYSVDYLKKDKGINNMLVCYSPDAFSNKEEYLERYPGDDYVDILGFDDYKSLHSDETRDIIKMRLEVVNDLAKQKDKLATVAETGYETLSDTTWFTNVLLKGLKSTPKTDRVSYVLVWRNARPDHHYAPYPGHPVVPDFLKFKADSSIFFLDDLPDMYN